MLLAGDALIIVINVSIDKSFRAIVYPQSDQFETDIGSLYLRPDRARMQDWPKSKIVSVPAPRPMTSRLLGASKVVLVLIAIM